MSTAGAWNGRGRDDDGLRASLHRTARGPMPPSAWVRLPAAQARARFGRTPERPWIVPAAIGWLARRMRLARIAGRGWRVLELGAGRSTPWLALRADSVLSFEDDPFWLERTRERLRDQGLANVDLRELPVEELCDVIRGLPDDSYDLVAVDFLESPDADRVDAVREARTKVRPDGLLLLDDSDRPAYAEAFDLLADWPQRRFAGVKDGWPQAVETTIFRRPR